MKVEMTERLTEAEWRARDDLRRHWGAFCDCDPFPGADTFPERMEAAGLIRLRAVRKRDIDSDSFAAERGIVLGGTLWDLTDLGYRTLSGGDRDA